jgi:secondary thiamine-phosphate synthase enzyme
MQRFTIEVETEGNNQILNLELELGKHLKNIRGSGLLHLFVPGSTAAITTIEYERGLVKHDLAAALQRLIPDNIPYEHEATWNDDNGHSHIRASFFGPELTVPFADGQLMTGEWQQVVLIDFDTRPRRRTVIVTVMQ